MQEQDTKYTAIIVDDESKARQLLNGLLETFCEEITVVAECADLPACIKAIRKQKPDLVFLDIEMPGSSGLEILNFFNEDEIDFEIIFTTAYDQYAIRAFKLSAIDYLLKPIAPDDLIAGVKHFIKKKKSPQLEMKLSKDTLSNLGVERLAIPLSNGFKFVELKHIVYFKAEGSYTEIVTIENEKLIASRNLKNFEDALDNNKLFFRCHKSYIVNTQFISAYIKSDGGYLQLQNDQTLPISPDKVNELMQYNISLKR